MNISQNGLNFIKKWEGFKPKPYRDSIGIPTIGIGTISYPNGVKVKMEDNEITEVQAFIYLRAHLGKIEVFLNGLKLNQNQYDSLCSFIYNLGVGNFSSSTLLKKIKANPNDPSISDEFKKWNKAGGKVIQGLINRRKEEAELYFK